MSDNGPPFNSHEFRRFSEDYEFGHITSSPGYPQSNGKAENAVKQIKRLLEKTGETKSDPYLALLELRNIPTEGINSSPVQRLMGRRTRTKLPTHSSLLVPETPTGTSMLLQKRKDKQCKFYNRSAKDLNPLRQNMPVLVAPRAGQEKWRRAVVMDQVGNRSYLVKTEDGAEYRRNRRHLREDKSRTEVSRERTSAATGEQSRVFLQTDDASAYLRIYPKEEVGTDSTGAPSTGTPLAAAGRSPYLLRNRRRPT